MYTSLLNYPIMYQVNAGSSPSFHLEADLFLRNKHLEYFDEPVWFSLFGRYFVTKKNYWAFFPEESWYLQTPSIGKTTSEERERRPL